MYMDRLKQFDILAKYKALIHTLDVQLKMTSHICGFELSYSILTVGRATPRPR